MRLALFFAALIVAQAAFPTNTIRPGQENEATSASAQGQKLVCYSNHILQWWPPSALAQYLGIPGYTQNTKYNYIILTFWLSTGAADTALVWQDPLMYFSTDNPFGSTKEEIQRNILQRYHDAGIKLLVSAFGATEFPTTGNLDPVTTCSKLADWAIENRVDGVDLDWEDNDALNTGKGEEWLIQCTKTLRQKLPADAIVTHAPQGPYFSGKPKYPNGGYIAINEAVGDLIDWYNVQFYNQGTTRYDSYNELFVDATGEWAGTAVEQIIAKGVPQEKVVVGKPVSTGDATNTGWVSPSNLGLWAKQATQQIGWDAGIMTWQYSSDVNGQYIGAYLTNYNS